MNRHLAHPLKTDSTNGNAERCHHSAVTTSDGIATDHLLYSAATLEFLTFQGAPDNVQ
jgi:hypothetical protein